MSKVGLEQALGKQLQAARRQAGLTQQQMCHQANLSYSTLAKIERGAIRSPSIFTILSIAEVLGLSLDELVGRQIGTGKNAKQVSKSGVRFAYFDINGCLVRFFHRAFNKLAQDTGVPPDLIESNFWHYNDQVCRGELSLAQFNKKLADGVGVDNVDWQKYYLAAVEPIAEMRELLTWATKHYDIGLISNIMPGLIDVMREHKQIPDVAYAAIVDSSKVKAIKPEKKIYEIAQKMAECKPEEILLVDDSRTNIMAAEKMGWHVLWFDDFRVGESIERIKKSLEF